MRKNYIYLIFLLFISCAVNAQMKKADKHFSKYNYAKAIPVYEKIAKSKSPDKQLAMIKLADCYRILNNYTKAESYYAQAIRDRKSVV